MKYYLFVQKNEMINFAGKWKKLENIKLDEVTQTPKDKSRMFCLVGGS